MRKITIWLVGGSIAAVALITGFLFFNAKPSLHGAVIDPPFQAAEIQIKDFNSQPFVLSGLRGKVVVLYFGYTNCPDECPLTMAHLKQATDALGPSSKEVQVIMISTDPTRDSSIAMKDFLGKFSPSFIGISGKADELGKIWKDYGVTVEDGGETHSYFVYIIDRKGNFRETFLPDSSPSDIAADLRLLINEQ